MPKATRLHLALPERVAMLAAEISAISLNLANHKKQYAALPETRDLLRELLHARKMELREISRIASPTTDYPFGSLPERKSTRFQRDICKKQLSEIEDIALGEKGPMTRRALFEFLFENGAWDGEGRFAWKHFQASIDRRIKIGTLVMTGGNGREPQVSLRSWATLKKPARSLAHA